MTRGEVTPCPGDACGVRSRSHRKPETARQRWAPGGRGSGLPLSWRDRGGTGVGFLGADLSSVGSPPGLRIAAMELAIMLLSRGQGLKDQPGELLTRGTLSGWNTAPILG